MKSTILVCTCMLFLTFMVFSCQRPSAHTLKNNSKSGWKAVYKHDESGKQIEGSIDSLIAGIRNGYDIRVGWGWEKQLGDSIVRLEHFAEPIFLTIIQEKNVSVIIDAHPLLASYVDISNQKIAEGGPIWQCTLTTTGEFNAQVHDRASAELIRDWPQRQRMTWFLEYPL